MRVGIIDDRPDDLLTLEGELEEAGHDVVAREVPLQDLGELVGWLSDQNVEALVCDQRLSAGAYAPFAGAEAVAEVIETLHVPALLVTSYIDTTEVISIRRWRARVPVLISKSQLSPETINTGFAEARAELEGQLPTSRIPRRTTVHVEGVYEQGPDLVVEAIIPGWDPAEAVTFPLDLVDDDDLKKAVHKGQIEWLIALVNVDAQRSDELYFQDFEPAPDPVLPEGIGIGGS